jgi:D-alanine-D-alanine ligase
VSTHVAVVGGGRSSEHEVSLASAAGVADALRDGGYTVSSLTIERDGRWTHDGAPLGATVAASLAAAVTVLAATDAVVPVVHGRHGEDGTLAALCDLAGVPCVGSPLAAGALAMDKWVTKLVARAVGVTVAPGLLVSRGDAVRWTRPVVVKPVSAGSSHGVTLVDAPEQLAPALAAAFDLDDRVLVEDVVVGREVDVAVLRRADGTLRVAPPLEVVVERGWFDAASKYDGSARFECPAHLDADTTVALVDAAAALYEALGCSGVARVDFFVTDDGPVLNEVNTTPGSTAQSQVPRMYAADGLGFAGLLRELVSAALLTYRAGSWHPLDRNTT